MHLNELRQLIKQIPRIKLGIFPTPLEKWSRLQADLKRQGLILSKREDLSGFALGGNKVRQLEFLLGDALDQGANVIVHGGAVQSNYSRMLAAASAKLNLKCHLVLCRHYNQPEDQGNCLLTRLFGATVHWYEGPLGNKYELFKKELAGQLETSGKKPYLITYPNSEILGTIAFVDAALELWDQCIKIGIEPKILVTPAVGSTQSGLMLGLRLLGSKAMIIGFSPLREEFDVKQTIRESIEKAAKKLGTTNPTINEPIINETEFVGQGYAKITEDAIKSILKIAHLEGALLDPVYTGKAMAGLLSYLYSKRIGSKENIIFVHTGGVPALFAYNSSLLEYLE